MMAHADETDDSHTKTRVHSGSAVVPAALVMSEREDADGISFLKSVVVGYDVAARMMTPVLGEDRSEKLINKIWNLEQVKNMRELRPLLSAF